MDQALGTAVFAGMIGVTFFGVLFTPIFFSVLMKLFGGRIGGKGRSDRRRQVGHLIDEEEQMAGVEK
jgi:hypothetical protein